MGDTSSFKLTTGIPFFFKFLCFVLAFHNIASAQNSDEKAKALYFHNLYQKYYSSEIDNFEEVIETNGVDKTYVIQDGDNLYDLSATLFGSSSFWPKIWSINAGLGNPHLIYKGRVISFVGGSAEEAPDISVGSDSSSIKNLQTGIKKGKTSATAEAAIAETRKLDKKPGYTGQPPILLPASLPSFASLISFQKDEFKSVSSVDADGRDSYFDSLVYKPRSIITLKPQASEGFIQGIFRGGNNANFGETVILKSNKDINIGDHIVAFHSTKLKGVRSDVGAAPYVVQRTGTLRVDKSLGKSRYLAEVLESYDFVAKGDSFFTGRLQDIVIKKDEVPTALVTDKEVIVLGGEMGFTRQVLGTGDIVYLSKGRNGNLELGQMYLVYTNRSVKVSEPGVKYAKNLPVSLLKVIDLEDQVATAILVDNVDEVSRGDYLNIRERNDK